MTGQGLFFNTLTIAKCFSQSHYGVMLKTLEEKQATITANKINKTSVFDILKSDQFVFFTNLKIQKINIKPPKKENSILINEIRKISKGIVKYSIEKVSKRLNFFIFVKPLLC